MMAEPGRIRRVSEIDGSIAEPRASARLGFGGQRRRAPDQAALARRRVAVSVLKRALPVLAFAALALVALWPQIAGLEEGIRVSYRKPTLSTQTGAASVLAPRFQGTDERGRPYTLSAESAVQPAGSEVVDLAQPRGDLTLEDGAWVMLQSDDGRFNRGERVLDLSGNVAVFHDSGYEVRTDSARVDLRAGRAEGDQPVAAQGPAGTLDALGFTISERGDVVVFGGPARMVLSSPSGAPAPPEGRRQ